jgi:hypothetical protein
LKFTTTMGDRVADVHWWADHMECLEDDATQAQDFRNQHTPPGSLTTEGLWFRTESRTNSQPDAFLASDNTPTQTRLPVPDSFKCPISHDLMVDPIVDPEANTYDRASIEQWLVRNPTSPITRSRMTKDDLTPNRALADSIVTFKPMLEIKPNADSIAAFKPMLEIKQNHALADSIAADGLLSTTTWTQGSLADRAWSTLADQDIHRHLRVEFTKSNCKLIRMIREPTFAQTELCTSFTTPTLATKACGVSSPWSSMIQYSSTKLGDSWHKACGPEEVSQQSDPQKYSTRSYGFVELLRGGELESPQAQTPTRVIFCIQSAMTLCTANRRKTRESWASTDTRRKIALIGVRKCSISFDRMRTRSFISKCSNLFSRMRTRSLITKCSKLYRHCQGEKRPTRVSVSVRRTKTAESVRKTKK